MEKENLTDNHVNTKNVNMSNLNFGTEDYILFGIMLTISASIGVYFGFFSKSKDTAEEYLVGGRKMKVIPVAISLIASQLSPISIMTLPAETYSFGWHIYWHIFSIIPVLAILYYILIPVLYKNNFLNCYEYLEKRFDRKTRRIVTIAFLMKMFLILSVYIFMPSLAFSQVTGINIHLINGIVCSVCAFYTMLGGIKAVVWTDVVQAAIMLLSVVLVVVLAIIKIGGITEVFQRAGDGGRLYMTNFSLDLTTRTTFWNTFLGGMAHMIAHIGVHQSCVQRIISLPTLSASRKCLVIFALGYFLIMSWISFTGIVMYAEYYLCDPVKAGIVQKNDKLLPFFIQDTIGHLRGMPGIFISCILSAALSTVSACLNTVAGIVYFDFIRPFVKKENADKKANFYMKIFVLVCGAYCILGGLVVEKFESIFQITTIINGMTQGAIAGVFLLGMLFPHATADGAFYGTVFSMMSVGLIIIGTQYHMRIGSLKYDSLPTSLDNCEEAFNMTILNSIQEQEPKIVNNEDIFILFRISFFWFIFFGMTLVWIFAIPYSFLVKDKNVRKIDLNLMSPIVRKWIPKSMCLQHEEIPMKEEFVKEKQHFVNGDSK